MTISENVHQSEFQAAGDMSDLINHELQQDSQYHPNLGGVTQSGMANHFPMTILSLQGLGASDEEVVAFRNAWPRYRADLTDQLGLQDRHRLNTKNWPGFLGQPDYLLEFRRIFLAGLGAATSDSAYVVDVISQMRHALPMGLFHPLIRISFACMHGDKGLIADGLAYMAIRYFDLYQTDLLDGASVRAADVGKPASAQSCWRQVHTDAQKIQLTREPQGGSLRICEQFCAEPDIQAMAFSASFSINVENLQQRIQQISLVALRLYLQQPALTTLHGVTACQALADISQRAAAYPATVEKLVILWQYYWVWLTGLYLEKGFPAQLPTIEPAISDEVRHSEWSTLAANARQIPEVHLIKMVFSCKWLFENVEANDLYKLAAVKILKERNAHPRNSYGLALGDK
jgi:hypothetical protein